MKINLKSNTVKYLLQIMIDPELAKAMLATSPGNRRIRQNTVLEYKEAMRQGAWRQNGDVIRFDRDGRLRDGHHRLNAIILFGAPVVMDVAIGLDEEALFSIDCGIQRRLSDFYRMFGERKGLHATHRAAYLSMCAQLLTGTNVPIRTLDSSTKWETIFGRGVDWAISDIVNFKIVKNQAVAGALAFAYRANDSAIREFASQVCLGERLVIGDPAHTLRRLIFEGTQSGGHAGADSKLTIARKVLNCAKAAISGRHYEKVYDTAEGLKFFREAYTGRVAQELSFPWKQQTPEGASAE